MITVGVDDRNRSGPRGVQMVSGSEMAGARIRVVLRDGVAHDADFDAPGQARVALSDCRPI